MKAKKMAKTKKTKEGKSLFFLTTIGLAGEGIKFDRERCVGYFKNFGDAERVVLDNIGDIYEAGYYRYCVIEELRPGLYPADFGPAWYEARWNAVEDKYEVKRIPRPEFAKHTVGWGIG